VIVAFMQRADADRLARARRQGIGPVQGPGAQLVAVEIAGPHVEQGGTKPVFPGVFVLLDETDSLKRPQEPVHGPFREPHLAGDVDHPESPVAPG